MITHCCEQFQAALTEDVIEIDTLTKPGTPLAYIGPFLESDTVIKFCPWCGDEIDLSDDRKEGA